MKRHTKTKRYRAKAVAAILTVAMIVQTAALAMASPPDGDALSVSAGENIDSPGESYGADAESDSENATPSDATPSESEEAEKEPDQTEDPEETQKDPEEKPDQTGKPENVEQPEKTEKPAQAENGIKASPSNALLMAAENILPNGSFENTVITTENWKWAWYNAKMPKGWDTEVIEEGNKATTFRIVESKEGEESEAQDGENYLHIHSTGTTAKIGIKYSIKGIDPTKEYLCTFWLKTANVTGGSDSGFYVRLARLEKDNSEVPNVETTKIKGTTDGWGQYGLMTKGLPSDNTEGLQIGVFADYINGDILLDDIQIVPAYSLSLNKKDANMFTEDTLQLEASFSDGIEKEVEWSSQNPEIADVDENGLVTAYKTGITRIVAKTDEYHEAVCEISVEDKELRPYYQVIRENWRNRLTGNNVEDPSDEVYQAMMADLTDAAGGYWETMNKGGLERTSLWDDIDFTYRYQDTYSNVTEGLGTGFSRIEQMATAYSAKGSELYQDEDLKADIIGALEWVYDNMYNDTMSAQNDTYGNWWHWFIGMPQSLCNTVILMYEELDPALIDREAKTLENFNWDPKYRYVVCGGKMIENTAGNLIDTSLVSALRAAIEETAKPLNMAKESLDQTIGFVSKGNGYYEDGSYIDHGNLAYTGGYGSTLLGGMEKLLFITDESPWEVDSDQLSSVYQWIWNGIRPLYADGAVMDMTTGRGIARPSTNDHTVGRGLLKPISHLVDSAPEEEREALRAFARTEIEAGVKYNDKYFIGMTVADMMAMRNLLADTSLGEDDEVYHKNFGAMDKAAYHGENFDLGISMYSKRTGNFEYGNKENQKGWHMSDGALYLYNGDQSQYADVYWPTVDPHRLAGITTDHTEGYIPASNNSWNPHVSTNAWVGGSSVLSQYGTVGMDFEGETQSGGISTLKAKKSWFTFPNGVVALGAGISSSEGKATETIVDNRKAMEDAANTVWVDGKEADLTVGEAAVMPMSWALLEGNNGEEQNIGYYFPKKTDITVLKETRTGNWRDINTAIGVGSANDRDIIRSYISFAVEHGTNPENQTYSYVLLPGRSPDEMAEYAANPEVKILANTALVQAVENTAYGVSGYNFWTAYDGSDLEVSAKTPASLTIAKEDGTATVGISNPTQNGQDTTIVLNSIYEVLEAEDGVTVTKQSGRTIITIKGAEDFGKTYTVVLEDLEKKIKRWKDTILNSTLAERADVEAILAEAQSIDWIKLNEEQRQLLDSVIDLAKEQLVIYNGLYDELEKVLNPIRGVKDVTFENADTVEALLGHYDALADTQKALLSEADKAIIKELTAGFRKKEIHTEANDIVVTAVNGPEDVRTLFILADESASAERYQGELSQTETLLNLYRPGLFRKNKPLSLADIPVRVTMKAPSAENGVKGTLKLYCFAAARLTRASVASAEVPLTTNSNGTITFEINQDGLYGFVLETVAGSLPNSDTDQGDSDEDRPVGTWIKDTNGWWFRHRDGTWPSSQWKWINGRWYHFNESGYMQTGWILDKGLWYYLKPDGGMANNEWVLYKDHWYYLSGSGAMAANSSMTWNGVAYQLGADGAMVE